MVKEIQKTFIIFYKFLYIKENPFPDKPPKYIRVEHYIYNFVKPGNIAVWERERIGTWLSPMSKEDIHN